MDLLRSASRVALLSAALVLTFATCDRESPLAPTSSPEEPKLAAPTSYDVGTAAIAVLVGAGDIASCSTENDAKTAELVKGIAGTVFTAGDNAYSSGSLTEYNNCYGPTWGVAEIKSRTKPAPGNRDYSTANAQGYFDYFGPAAGQVGKGYYSYDLGDWHVVVLNSKLSMSATSAQTQWLKSDLAANPKFCTIAYWHLPRFYSSGSSGLRSSVKPVWDVLYNQGVDVVVNSDNRFYERFAPQDPNGVADNYGIREFIVGTGGASSSSFGTIRPNSEARSTKVPGVIKLTLNETSYGWEFVPIPGVTPTFTDSDAGTPTNCHGAPPPIARPGGPHTAEATVTFNGSASSDPQGDTPLTYDWDFGDGSPHGTGSNPTHEYTVTDSKAVTPYTVTLVVTDSKGNPSAAATTTATIANIAPTVNAGADKTVNPGVATTLTFTFSDPGPNDNPWSYTIDWGDLTPVDPAKTTDDQSAPISEPHTYAAVGDYNVLVTVTDNDGGAGTDQMVMRVRDPGTPAVIVIAGDIAECGSNNRDNETAKLIEAIPEATVFTAGDNAYPNGRAQDYTDCYAPTWGRPGIKNRTWANLGNHEYDTGNANASWDYYNGVNGEFGERAGPRGKGYYSMDIGDWHIIVLNDNKSFVPFAAGSAQDLWLQNDLATNTKKCTLAIWHQARFYSSSNSTTVRSSWKILWDRLYAKDVDVTVHGHQHRYERFAPQDPDGKRDDVRGIKEFIVGTGGSGTAMPAYIAANSEVVSEDFGIMKLTLHSDWYEWEFKPIPGYTFTDAGTGLCH